MSDIVLPKALALTVGGVDVTDARIRYQDRQTGQTIELDKLSLLTGEILEAYWAPLWEYSQLSAQSGPGADCVIRK